MEAQFICDVIICFQTYTIVNNVIGWSEDIGVITLRT